MKTTGVGVREHGCWVQIETGRTKIRIERWHVCIPQSIARVVARVRELTHHNLEATVLDVFIGLEIEHARSFMVAREGEHPPEQCASTDSLSVGQLHVVLGAAILIGGVLVRLQVELNKIELKLAGCAIARLDEVDTLLQRLVIRREVGRVDTLDGGILSADDTVAQC